MTEAAAVTSARAASGTRWGLPPVLAVVLALIGLLFLELDEFFFGLEDFLFLDGFAFQFGFADNAVCFACQDAQEQKVACASSKKQSSCCCNDG